MLLLGCFTVSRITVLERLREEPRKRDFLSMIFNFDKPETRNPTETVRLMSDSHDLPNRYKRPRLFSRQVMYRCVAMARVSTASAAVLR